MRLSPFSKLVLELSQPILGNQRKQKNLEMLYLKAQQFLAK